MPGARVWHLEDEIGTLTPGKQADIAVIDMRFPHLDGFGDPVAVMVLGAGPADVETVIVGGDIVKRDGKLAGDHVDHAHSGARRDERGTRQSSRRIQILTDITPTRVGMVADSQLKDQRIPFPDHGSAANQAPGLPFNHLDLC